MDLHAKDKTQHPENVELLSAQKPITDFKGLLTTIISAVVCFGIYSTTQIGRASCRERV